MTTNTSAETGRPLTERAVVDAANVDVTYTVRGADRIYVIDKGQVVETGDHDSLVDKRGLYARLARSQDLEAV